MQKYLNPHFSCGRYDERSSSNSHFVELPFFVWTILCKWDRTSHTQSEYPHVLLRPRVVGSTRQSLLGYGHALLRHRIVLYGHAFLGHRYSMVVVGRVWAGGCYANPCYARPGMPSPDYGDLKLACVSLLVWHKPARSLLCKNQE